MELAKINIRVAVLTAHIFVLFQLLAIACYNADFILKNIIGINILHLEPVRAAKQMTIGLVW